MNTKGLRHLTRSCALVLALLAAPVVALAGEAAMDCHLGTYRLADGSTVNIVPDDPGTFRWRRFDGTTGVLHGSAGGVWNSTLGWTDHDDGVRVTFPDCATGVIDFDGMSGQRLDFDVQDVTFESHGTKLAGRLILPQGTAKVPVVVQVHGSEDSSALNPSAGITYALQGMLPAEGIGIFAYDKRGTGKSAGQYTQDFSILADDAAAAVAEARRAAGARLGRIGFQGGSEAGWVEPIAANRTPVDFVIVSYGLAVDVIAEDQEAVELQMREKGYSPEVIRQALVVAGAAEQLFEDDFKGDFREYDAMRAKYANKPWYQDVHGDFAWFVLQQKSDADLRALAPKFDWHTPFHYDPMPTLRADKTPQLWILGGEDYEAPSAETIRRLKSLMVDGLPYTLAYFPHAEHGMTLFEGSPSGERPDTRYAPGYFAMMCDFARGGKLSGPYGDSEIISPAAVHR